DDGKVQMFLIGDSTETLNEIAEGVLPILAARPEFADVRVDRGDANSEVAVRVDRERAARMGFNAQEVASYIGIALRGAPLREFRHGDSEVPVTVKFAGSDDFGIDDLSSFYLRNAAGERVPLMSLVNVDVHASANRIARQNRQTALSLEADLATDVILDDARKAIESAMASTRLPPGYRWSLTGAFQRNDEAGARMAFNTLFALVIVYMLMAALFESLLFPAAILSNIGFSALGVFWFFWMTGTTFSIMASIGILVLMGVVVNNGIVMIEHINALRRSGMSRHAALVAGSRERLRPILMTMGTTILGMIPLCIPGAQIGGGGPEYYPMARAIVGGLAFSTVVSLLFLPTIYVLLEDLRLATARIVGRARQAAPLGAREATAQER
ncbi:MAG: efflux RND transporter permease subunit, partial [Xanthomonadales bacterium]|nr:efflux RND transporter permease subunit [Xanthomonadales bacterium]